jgi:DNA-binding CsgD family transcriptional regulator
VAAHLAAAPAGTLPDAAALLAQAGTRLLADGDAVTAATHLTRAVEEAPHDDELQARLGIALLRTGEAARAREHLRAAAQRATDPRVRAARLADAASATALADGPGAAATELRALLDDIPAPDTGPGRLRLEARLATVCALLPEESRRSADRLAAFADLPGATPEERAVLALAAQRARYDVRPAAEIRALAERALGDGAFLADSAAETDGLTGWLIAVIALTAADGVAPAAAELARARARIRREGSPVDFGLVSVAGAWHAWRTGDVAGAEGESDAALAALAAEPPASAVVASRTSALHCWVLAVLERGDRAGAAAALRAHDAAGAEHPRVITASSLREARALVALAHDEPTAALREALLLGDELRAAALDTPTVAWRVPAALAALALGQEEQARRHAADHVALAERAGTATDLGAALRLRARVERDERLELLGAAIAVLEGSPARLELARALTDLGEALRVERQRRAAHAPLERAAELAAACHAPVLRRRALEGLAALGDQPRKLMFSGEESLTASERRVARLAVDGRSNRVIAQELFVTPKTVENHLGRVYAKLGISSRRQLAETLG